MAQNFTKKTPEYKYWLAAFALLTPVLLLYAGHFLEFLSRPDLIPTGFLGKRDAPYYMALAREYYDRGDFNLFYPLPFSDNPNNNAIYFQPHLLFLGTIQKVSGISPGIIFALFGFAAGTVCIYFQIKLFETLFGLETLAKKTTLLLFSWGGGLLTLCGLIYSFFTSGSLKATLLNMFVFDPDKGWWGLNLGRNLIYPTEAYYHAVAIAILYFVCQKRMNVAYGLAFLLSLSQPHTGITFIGILWAWTAFEKYFIKNTSIRALDIVVPTSLLAYHVVYYLIFLEQNPEHREIVETHWVDTEKGTGFVYHAKNFIPGYALVVLLMTIAYRKRNDIVQAWANPFNRFLATMTIAVLALSNHDLIFTAHQPLHFEKGYVYTGLFLLSAPVLISFFGSRFSPGFSKTKKWAAIGIISLFLLDNTAWFSFYTYENFRGHGLRLTNKQSSVLNALNKPELKDYLIVSEEQQLAYWAMVFTPMRSFASHEVTTPNLYSKLEATERLFKSGELDERLKNRKLVLIDRLDKNPEFQLTETDIRRLIFKSDLYAIYQQKL